MLSLRNVKIKSTIKLVLKLIAVSKFKIVLHIYHMYAHMCLKNDGWMIGEINW